MTYDIHVKVTCGSDTAVGSISYDAYRHLHGSTLETFLRNMVDKVIKQPTPLVNCGDCGAKVEVGKRRCPACARAVAERGVEAAQVSEAYREQIKYQPLTIAAMEAESQEKVDKAVFGPCTDCGSVHTHHLPPCDCAAAQQAADAHAAGILKQHEISANLDKAVYGSRKSSCRHCDEPVIFYIGAHGENYCGPCWNAMPLIERRKISDRTTQAINEDSGLHAPTPCDCGAASVRGCTHALWCGSKA